LKIKNNLREMITKRQLEASLKQIAKAAQINKQVSIQNYELATRVESEAISALEIMGVSKGRPPKGKHELPDNIKLSLLGGLTKTKKPGGNRE
jgi:hypothetical protein